MTTTSTFARWRSSKLLPPIAGPMDELFAAVFGATQDAELALLRVAALSRLPATCPDDGLDLLGQTFVLPRFPDETYDIYRARLLAAWPTYYVAGAPDAITASLNAYGIPDVEILREEDAGYPNVWYSRFDVYLGPDFGVATIERMIIDDPVCTMSADYVQPAVGASVTVDVSISDPSALVGEFIFIGQGGYYLATASGVGTLTVTNLGDSSEAGAVYGVHANTAPGATVSAGQMVVLAGCLIIDESHIGISFVYDSQRVAVKAQILRWKAAHGYAGHLWLRYDNDPIDPGEVEFHYGLVRMGYMIDDTFNVGDPIGGYDRS